jgi:hypothetical protein
MKELINNLEYVETLTKEGREKLKRYVKDLEENNNGLQDSIDIAIGNWLGLSSKIGELRTNIEDRITVINTTYLGENSTRYSDTIVTEMTARKQTYESVLLMIDRTFDNE